jgi:hypothetical protein
MICAAFDWPFRRPFDWLFEWLFGRGIGTRV